MISLYDYQWSRQLESMDPPFYGLLAALIRKADSDNLAKIEALWPDEVRTMRARHNAPGGLLPGEAR